MDRDKERKVSARDGIPPFLLILKVKIFHAHTQDLSESWLLGCSFGTASVLLPPSIPPHPSFIITKGWKEGSVASPPVPACTSWIPKMSLIYCKWNPHPSMSHRGLLSPYRPSKVLYSQLAVAA